MKKKELLGLFLFLCFMALVFFYLLYFGEAEESMKRT